MTIALHRADVRRPGRDRPDAAEAVRTPAGTNPGAPAAAQAAACTTAALPPAADELLSVLRDGLLACAELDPDTLDARTARGAAAVRLAGLARAASAALGAAPGTDLAAGPGVVVVRDLAVATALLDGAAQADRLRSAAAADLAPLVAAARRALATLEER